MCVCVTACARAQINRTAMLRCFLMHDIDLLRTRDGGPVDLHVFTVNAILRMSTVLQDEDFAKTIANLARHPPRIVVNHGGVQMDIRDVNPRVVNDGEALLQLQGCVSTSIMGRWTRMCNAIDLDTRVLALRWFARQRYFY